MASESPGAEHFAPWQWTQRWRPPSSPGKLICHFGSSLRWNEFLESAFALITSLKFIESFFRHLLLEKTRICETNLIPCHQGRIQILKQVVLAFDSQRIKSRHVKPCYPEECATYHLVEELLPLMCSSCCANGMCLHYLHHNLNCGDVYSQDLALKEKPWIDKHQKYSTPGKFKQSQEFMSTLRKRSSLRVPQACPKNLAVTGSDPAASFVSLYAFLLDFLLLGKLEGRCGAFGLPRIFLAYIGVL